MIAIKVFIEKKEITKIEQREFIIAGSCSSIISIVVSVNITEKRILFGAKKRCS